MTTYYSYRKRESESPGRIGTSDKYSLKYRLEYEGQVTLSLRGGEYRHSLRHCECYHVHLDGENEIRGKIKRLEGIET